MSVHPPAADHAGDAHGHDDHHGNYLTATTGLKSWLLTIDHKRIGLMYLVGTSIMFLAGGLFALLLRTELFSPEQILMDAPTYNQVFTLHGAIMVFLFIIPAVPAVLGNFFLPMQIGTIDVAFPKLNLASFYIWILGAVVCVFSIVSGGVDTGWTFYTPYSTDTTTSVISMTLGAFILGFSSILTGMNFITTVHKMRAPGMGWFQMPLFIWAIYATSIIQVLATPVLAITLLLLILERAMGIGIFDPALGGDPVLFQHFFWFYSHPAVYIMILPGMGIISELITTFSKRNIFGYKFIAFSSLGIAGVSFIVWGHHMFVSGQSELATMVFSALTFLVAIPTAIKMFNWTATLYRGSISFETPMIYTLNFMFMFAIGGFTGMHLATLATDIHLHDTYFVVAHFHYVMMGGTVMAYLGGLHYWWPKMFGKMYAERPAQLCAVLVFIGFNLLFFTQFFMGSQGMPRRYYTYTENFQIYHQISTIGAYILGTGLFGHLFILLASLKNGKPAPDNPWDARTLEWKSTSPPSLHNFETIPEVPAEAYDYRDNE